MLANQMQRDELATACSAATSTGCGVLSRRVCCHALLLVALAVMVAVCVGNAGTEEKEAVGEESSNIVVKKKKKFCARADGN